MPAKLIMLHESWQSPSLATKVSDGILQTSPRINDGIISATLNMKEEAVRVGVEIGDRADRADKADKGGVMMAIKETRVGRVDGVVIKEARADGEAMIKEEEDGENLTMEGIKEEDGETKEAMGGVVEATKGEIMDGEIVAEVAEVAETDGALIVVVMDGTIMVAGAMTMDGAIKVAASIISNIISKVVGAQAIMTAGEATTKAAIKATKVGATVQDGAPAGDYERIFIIK